jgi:3-hydroxyacyl-CoA dehydrogenase
MSEKISIISIIGAGYIGRQIIEKTALYGYNVKFFDVNLQGLNQEIFSQIDKFAPLKAILATNSSSIQFQN